LAILFKLFDVLASNKTDHHDINFHLQMLSMFNYKICSRHNIAEILQLLALNTNKSINQSVVVSFIGSKNIKELKQNSQKATKLTYP
jgi:hypothetical protein